MNKRRVPSLAARRGTQRAWRSSIAPTVLLLVCALSLVGCGLRLDTSDPAPPSPGPSEQARARTVTDAVALADAASALAATADDTLSPVLADLVAFSTAHVEALGGVYDSGLPAASPTTTPPPPPVPTGPELLDQLVEATTTAATDTDQVDDPDLARVLGSVATARGELTVRLAAALSVESPGATTSPADQPDTAPPDTAPSVTAPSEAVSPADVSPGAVSSAAASPGAATTPPGPVAPDLALAHDQAGYAFEVVAARAPSQTVTTWASGEFDLRVTARTAAEHHRAQSAVWAQAGGFDGTAQDPRLAQYQLPDNLDDPTVTQSLAISLEQAVAQAASAALAAADPGTRADLLTDLRTATAAATGWGADPEALPGLPSSKPPPSPSPSP